MNHVYAKIKHRGKSNKYRKVLSINENIYHPADELIESSCPYTPGTMLETGAWFKISEFSKQKYSITSYIFLQTKTCIYLLIMLK